MEVRENDWRSERTIGGERERLEVRENDWRSERMIGGERE